MQDILKTKDAQMNFLEIQKKSNENLKRKFKISKLQILILTTKVSVTRF